MWFDAKTATILSIGKPRNDVEVHVHDHLASLGPVVLEDVVGGGSSDGADRSTEPWEHSAQGRGGVVGEFPERRLLLLGNQEHVSTAEGADVQEGEDMIVLMDAMAGDLAGKDLREDGHEAPGPGSSRSET